MGSRWYRSAVEFVGGEYVTETGEDVRAPGVEVGLMFVQIEP